MSALNSHLSENYSELIRRLKIAQRKKLRVAFWSKCAVGISILIIFILVLSLSEEYFHFSGTGRLILFYFLIVGSALIMGWYIVIPFLRLSRVLRIEPARETARLIGSFFPEIKDRLIDAVQVYEDKKYLQNHYSVELIDASFKDLFDAVAKLNFGEAIDESSIKKSAKYFFVVLFLFLITNIISPAILLNPFYRIIHYSQSFSQKKLIEFNVEPGNVEVVRGADVIIKVQANVDKNQAVILSTCPAGQHVFESNQMKQRANSSFITTLNNLVSTTEYYATAGDVSSEKFTIKVIDRPFIRSLNVTITPPAYTRMQKSFVDENSGDIRAYAGSTVHLDINSNKELISSLVMFNDSSVVNLKTNKINAAGDFILRKNGSYKIIIEDASRLVNIDPVEYSVTVIPDDFPSIEILSPGKNIDLTTQMNLNLLIRIKDDFGFSKLKLWHRLAQSKYENPAEEFSALNLPASSSNINQADISYDWSLDALNLVPEDIVAYYAEVFDNDNISGPKASRTQIYILRLPSLEEVFTDVSNTQEESIESLKKIADEADKLKRDIEDLQRQTKSNKDKATWQQQKKIEEMVKRHSDLKRKLEETIQKMDEMLKKMDENKLLSDETMEKYREMQKLMEQLNAPELQNALRKLQDSMKKLSSDEMKQAMQKAQITEEQFKQSLERTIELLKRISIEQKLDELIKRSEELIKKQNTLQEATKKSGSENNKEELAQKQDELKKDLDAVEKETKSLSEKMEEFPKEMPLDEMAGAEEMMQKNQTGKKMQQSIMQMKSGNMQNASQSQKDAEQEMQDFKKQLEKTKKSLLERQSDQIVKEMRRQLENVIELSKEEEALKDNSRSLDPNSVRFRENTRKQNEAIENLGRIVNALAEVGKKSFAISPEMGKELGTALRQMGEAMQQMEYRNPAGTSQKQNEAMSSLNRAATMMQNALSSMMQGGKGGMGMAGLMARLEQMAGMQSGINQGTQQAMSMGKGGGESISAEQAAEYRRLAGQQVAAQKALEQLAEEAKSTGDYNRLLGNLEQISKEMKEVETDLQQGNVNSETKERQERIFSRLLESTRSMRERDYEKRRRAEEGKNIPKITPAEIDLSTQSGLDWLREELLKIREGKYTKDYQDLIKNYFEQLQKENIKK
ncbi:MAG: hypothetical protein HZB59_13205 [Ignavibacteriales bacterium]|nr:hypothetical protein [Ignavibacteriales bacterium]